MENTTPGWPQRSDSSQLCSILLRVLSSGNYRMSTDLEGSKFLFSPLPLFSVNNSITHRNRREHLFIMSIILATFYDFFLLMRYLTEARFNILSINQFFGNYARQTNCCIINSFGKKTKYFRFRIYLLVVMQHLMCGESKCKLMYIPYKCVTEKCSCKNK